MADIDEPQESDGSTPVVFTELGKTGLSRFGGEIREDEIRDLRGHKSIEQFKEMRDNDAMVGALLFVIKNLIRQADWEVVGGEEEDREFLKEALRDMKYTWGETLSSILSFLPFGYSVFEVVWKKREGRKEGRDEPDSEFDDGMIGWHKFAPRAQETIEWVFDDSGNLQHIQQDMSGVRSSNASGFLDIPLEKALVFQTELGKENPTGKSILRSAWRSWYFKKNVEELEGIGIERDLAGLPVAWVPENIAQPDTDEEKQIKKSWEDMVVNVRNDEQMGLVLPLAYTDGDERKYDFELISSGGDPKIDTSEVIQRYDTRILQTVMADFIMLGTEARGSFALSKSKTDLFSLAISTYLDIIEDKMNNKAIPKLFKVNGMADKELPELKHGKVKPPSLEEIGNFIAQLSASGMRAFPNEELRDKLLEMAGINIEEGEGPSVNPEDVEDPIDDDQPDQPDQSIQDSLSFGQEDIDKKLRDQILSNLLPELSDKASEEIQDN